MTTLIDPSAELDEGVYVGPNVVIGPNVRIGERTRIEGFASIGSPAEHRDHYHDEGPFGVEIGRDCVVREFVTVNAGTWRTTSVGPDSALLRGAYVGHDVLIGEAATISADALLGGHVVVGDGANLGLGYRSSNWLKLCIASVADQGVAVEHLVQDAGSDDGTQRGRCGARRARCWDHCSALRRGCRRPRSPGVHGGSRGCAWAPRDPFGVGVGRGDRGERRGLVGDLGRNGVGRTT